MKIKRAGAIFLIAAILFTTLGAGADELVAQAATGYGTATVRVLATTDMHGQSVRLNYDSGVEGEGSLAQIAGIIKRLRKQMKYGTTVTVDCGDNVYGIGSESIMKGTVSGAEYMYEEMAALNYDAITLGNHDFDYGADYIKKSLSSSGMSSKVVLSNVVDAKTKKNLYPSTKMITRTVTTTTGKKRTIKIGFVGAVIPSLTSKTDGMSNQTDSDASDISSLVTHVSWKGIIETKDIVSSVQTQAKALKKKGANLVIVLAHSGIGNENYKTMDDNAGYALTAIPEVDAVCAGHTHMNFPSDDSKAEPYYDYSETDGDGLMHGKPLIEEKDHGASLGIADLKIGFSQWGTPYVKSSSARIRKIKSSDKEDAQILEINQKYNDQYLKIYDQAVTTTDHETDNYFGMIEDNPLIHLCNAAKIEYGLRAVQNLDDKYKNATVIAATEYQMAGQDSSSNYIKVDGTVHVKDLLNLEAFNQQRAKVYYMTGAQLRESLEWQVGRFFETTGTEADTEGWDEETKSLVAQGLKPVLSPEYQKNGWKGFTVYDGIEYVVDPSKEPRYDENGNQISDSRRIISLTKNGQPVSDSDIFVLVSKNISSNTDPVFSKYANKQLLVSKTAHISSMLENYMKLQTVNDKLQMAVDGNWKIAFAEGTDYVIKSASAASDVAKTKTWYQGEIPARNGYTFYKAALGNANENVDRSGPFVVASPMETRITGDDVRVRVEANDISGISKIQYIGGTYSVNDPVWDASAIQVNDNDIDISENGTYTVRAVDTLGNANVCYVTVNNIDRAVSVAPTLEKLTNRTVTLNGKASSFADVHFEVSGETYDIKADENGKFTTKIAPPKAGDVAELYQVDLRGRKSSVVQIAVARTGADTPEVNDITNTSNAITGLYDDDSQCTIIAVNGKTVYVPKGSANTYKESSNYKSSQKVVQCSFNRTGDTFSLSTPIPLAGDKFTVYGMDWIGRLSTKTNKTTQDVAPNQPRLMSVVAEEGMVYGRIPEPKADSYAITVTASNGATYTGTAASDGHFGVLTDILADKTILSVTATDIVNGASRTSAAKSITAKTYLSFIKDFSGGVTFNDITDEDTALSGEIENGDQGTEARLLMTGQRIRFGEEGTGAVIDNNGLFSYQLTSPLSYGTEVAVVVRNSDHSMASVNETKVKEALPLTPTVEEGEDISTDTDQITVIGNRACTCVLKSGKVVKKTTYTEYREGEGGGYVYRITLPKSVKKDGRTCKVYLENSSGQSESYYFTMWDE